MATQEPSTNTDRVAIVDKRRNARLLEEIGSDDSLYKKNPNRLTNVRWKLGEEPDAEGNNTEDGWVNIKLDVTEHEAPETNQRHLLGGGAELKLPCLHCGQPMHIAAEKNARAVLEEGGFDLKGKRFEGDDEMLVAAVCPAGHITQLRERFIRGLIEES